MESQPQNTEFRNYPESFICVYRVNWRALEIMVLTAKALCESLKVLSQLFRGSRCLIFGLYFGLPFYLCKLLWLVPHCTGPSEGHLQAYAINTKIL